MKKILMICSVMLLLLSGSCNDMYDSIGDFVQEEKVYPGGFDFASGHIGIERVEIDLLYAGRIPASQINLGKAKKTVIEYDGKVVPIDSLCSWVNITGLKLPKLYRFKIYTIDEFGDKSIPVETALIPYTEGDKSNLVISSPKITYHSGGATISWSQSLNSASLNYSGLSFSYTDKNGTLVKGEQTSQTPSFTVDNLTPGQVTVYLKHTVIPKVNNTPIIDAVDIESTLVLTISE